MKPSGFGLHVKPEARSVRRPFSIEQLRGKSVNSPYLGRELPGCVVATVHAGVPTVLDGELRPVEEVARVAD